MSVFGLIAGTGFSDWLTGNQQHNVKTPYGDPAASISESVLGSYSVFYLPRHGNPHRLAPHAVNYKANIWALKSLGVQQLIAVNVVGSIRTEWPSGSLVVPDQIIDYTWGRAHTYFDSIEQAEQPIEHIDFTNPYDEALRDQLVTSGAAANVNIALGGCYAATQGPRLESAAEVQRIKRDGGDIIGMTGMPEASLARELGMTYASICLVSNLAAGVGGNELSMDQIMHNVHASSEKVQQVINQLLL